MELGWLSPNGDFYPCDLYDHIMIAEKLVEFYKYPETYSGDIVLMNHGWVHITSAYGYSELHIYWDKHLTDYQKNFLKKYFEQDEFPISRISKVEWEGENNL